MEEGTTIGMDLTKRIFQVHGARADGAVALNRRIARAQLVPFLAKHPGAIVAMEAGAKGA